MNPEIGWARAQLPRPEPSNSAPTPLGYSMSVLLMLRIIDTLKEQIRVISAVFGGKAVPIQPEPRPMTAEDRFREQMETDNVYDAVARILGKKK